MLVVSSLRSRGHLPSSQPRPVPCHSGCTLGVALLFTQSALDPYVSSCASKLFAAPVLLVLLRAVPRALLMLSGLVQSQLPSWRASESREPDIRRSVAEVLSLPFVFRTSPLTLSRLRLTMMCLLIVRVSALSTITLVKHMILAPSAWRMVFASLASIVTVVAAVLTSAVHASKAHLALC